MHFNQRDIFTRRERSKRTAVFISQEWLVEHVKGLTESFLWKKGRPTFMKSVTNKRRRKQKVKPDTGANWRFAEKHNSFYYDYDRLPATRRKYLPSKKELLDLYKESIAKNAKSTLEADLLEHIKDVTRWLPAYADCTDTQAQHLARAAAVIQYAADEISRREPTRCNDYYRYLSAVVKKHGWVYLPTHYRRLKENITMVVEGADVTKVVTLPRAGNQNRAPYDDKQVISWLLYLRSRPENYSNAHIARRVLKMCAIAQKNAPSFSWIEHFFADKANKFLTGAARHRSGRKGANYRDYLPIAGALYAGDCWQMDGTRINFIPHRSEDGSEKSLIIIAVRDVHSGDIIGCHFDTKEDRYGYIHALNMAVVETGHLPYELVHDRFPGHNTDEWSIITEKMKREATKVTISSTATSKAHVERCFSTLQDVFMQDFPWYYGQGVQSRHEAAHRSPEYLVSVKKRARREGWDFNAAWRSAMQVVHNYRTTPLSEYSRKNSEVHESPQQLYQVSETPNVNKVDDFTRVELFGTMRKQTIRNNGIIRMRIHKAEYVYKIDDYDIIKHYKKVNVYYDLEDLSKIYLFAPEDSINTHFLCEVQEERAVQVYGPNADYERLAKMKKKRKEIRERRQQELEEVVAHSAGEVDLLLAAAAPKTSSDSAESAWLAERVEIWKDQGTSPRLNLPETPPSPEQEEEDIDINQLRNY